MARTDRGRPRATGSAIAPIVRSVKHRSGRLFAGLALSLMALTLGCGRPAAEAQAPAGSGPAPSFTETTPPTPAAPAPAPAAVPGEPADGSVVLYSSVDSYVLTELIAAFESQTGHRVRVVGDTEATKTTGLTERLIGESSRPSAHVWWSSEPFGTIRLAGLGVLEPFDPGPAGAEFEGGAWPIELADPGGLWHGFAERARVIAFHSGLMTEQDAPATLGDLASEAWAGRVGMAKPQFGTTRGHMAALLHAWGPSVFESWLTTLRDQGLVLYDGNAAVVRAIRYGEIDAGLTDSDDVFHAQRNGWAIGMVYERPTALGPYPVPGPLMLANTAGLVAGAAGRSPAAAELLRWILSPRAESILARSDSRNFPVFPSVRAEHPELVVHSAWRPDVREVAAKVGPAMEIVERVLGP